jgi:hypothetical protein
MADCTTLQATTAFVKTNKQLAEVQTEDNFIVTVGGGFGILTFALQSSPLPQLKNAGIEYSITGGIKQKAAGKVQPLQDLAMVFLERKDGSTTDMLQTIIKSNLNGRLVVTFYAGKASGNGDLDGYRLHSKVTDAGFVIEEGMNHDVEGNETVQKQSVTCFGNFLACEENDRHDSSNALATNALLGLPTE